MIFSNEEISNLRTSVKSRFSDRRYAHTLGVEKMAKYLGQILLPEKIDELCVAALLHDISKEIPYDEQVLLLNESAVSYSEEDLLTKPALHSISAIPLIQKEFPMYATADVLSSVKNHTLGNNDMSVFDEIIFISDYTEEGRTYHSCQEIRRYLLQNISKNNSYEQNLIVLHSATLDAIKFTIASLVKRDERIHGKTFLAQKHFESLIHK